MSLISTPYMLLVLGAGILYYLLPKAYRWIVLLCANIIFYLAASSTLSIYLFLSLLSVYLGTLFIQRHADHEKKRLKDLAKTERKSFKQAKKKQRSMILLGILAINVGILLYLKYFNFFATNVSVISSWLGIEFVIPAKTIVLPLGISYYTLMAISYIVDVYRQKYRACSSFWKVALYLTFFPQMTEGPISRFDQLADQLYNGNTFQLRNIKIGLYHILWGLFKKMVIADRAGMFVDAVFGKDFTGFTVVFAVLLYTIQIYAEFSGAMDLVRGTGFIFGVYMEENFQQPFFSKSIAEFWRRWHRTLGTWLKDYVFYSISLSKANLKLNRMVKKYLSGHVGKFIVSAFPLFFVWFINGFWHGASWKYITYGFYYYVIMMFGLLLQPIFQAFKKILGIREEQYGYQLFAMLRTTLIVCGGMLLFRSSSVMQAWSMFVSIFDFSPLQLHIADLKLFDYGILAVGVGFMFIVSLLKEKQVDLYEVIDQKSLILRYATVGCIILLLLIFGIYGEGYQASDFIYGAF